MSQPIHHHAKLAMLGLIAVTAIWGSTFFMIKDLVDRMPPADFLAVRFLIAALAMMALFFRQVGQLTAREWRQGLLLGTVYAIGQLTQTAGLAHTEASISGFATGMYVVFTPLLGTVLLRQRLPRITWVAVLLSVGGLAVLALRGLSLGFGVWITLASAVLYAMHIVGLGLWSRPGSAFALSTVQMIAISVICMLATLPHGPMLPPDGKAWLAVIYMALAAGAGAMLVQTWAQAHLSATRAAIVMTLEPVFAAAFAVMFGGEGLTWRMIVGGVLVLAAMYLVELVPRRDPELHAEALHHEV
ncbi:MULTISPECIES: DMT family transporter [Dyella]|uniref:DMT family transporter n=2 Tax=Dyella TaxID=231454 RepID=A0A4R0YUJ9_9GAMM|nr:MULTISPECIES: DMT family transporter [Dyella]TBR40279.1 DMT family transporter [Dyella terrae]TCI12141.1 DMT family transporter [Dyella soli]